MKIACSEQADMDLTRFARGRRKCDVVVGFDMVSEGEECRSPACRTVQSGGKQNLNR